MKTSVERILTTHVGSLVRTPAIIYLQIRRSLGEAVDGAQFDAAVRQGVSGVVQRQIQAGIDIVDDGEYGKLNWITYLGERLKGLDKTDLHTSVEDGARFWPEQERFGEFYQAYLRHETTDWLPDTPALKRYSDIQMTDYQNVVCAGELEYQSAPLQRDSRNPKDHNDGPPTHRGSPPPSSRRMGPHQPAPLRKVRRVTATSTAVSSISSSRTS